MNIREMSSQTSAQQTREANERPNTAQLNKHMVVCADSHSPPKQQKLSTNDNSAKKNADLKTTLYHSKVHGLQKDPQQIS